MRIAVLIEDRCKPNSPAFMYLQKYAGTCGGECIQVNGNKCKILESACPPCLVRAKHCPGDAVKIINLPEELDTDLTHRYGENGFRLFRLPAPKKLEVVGNSWCQWHGEINRDQSSLGYTEAKSRRLVGWRFTMGRSSPSISEG